MTTPHTPTPTLDHPTVFYDGECGLCDRGVRWLLRADRRATLRFAPLQGSTYAALNLPHKPLDMKSMVLVDHRGVHLRSDSTLRTLRHLGGHWAILASLALLVPRPLRDACYNIIAPRRKRFFGGAEACKLPTRADRDRLLP